MILAAAPHISGIWGGGGCKNVSGTANVCNFNKAEKRIIDPPKPPSVHAQVAKFSANSCTHKGSLCVQWIHPLDIPTYESRRAYFTYGERDCVPLPPSKGTRYQGMQVCVL